MPRRSGRELGVYTDPYQYFGYLDSQLFRAIRLVVDTGIHSKGWTRDQTIQYILDNSSRGRSNATAETERYIAIPGQALAYKIGQLKISELRARAEKALGPRFDIREFHEQVLMSGALPLAVLEQQDRRLDRREAGMRPKSGATDPSRSDKLQGLTGVGKPLSGTGRRSHSGHTKTESPSFRPADRKATDERLKEPGRLASPRPA